VDRFSERVGSKKKLGVDMAPPPAARLGWRSSQDGEPRGHMHGGFLWAGRSRQALINPWMVGSGRG